MLQLYVTMAPVGGALTPVDTIEYAGTLWLVTIWADQPDGDLTMPARLVCLSALPHAKCEGLSYDYMLSTSLAKELFDPDAPVEEKKGLIVVDPLSLQMPRNRRANRTLQR